MTFEPIITTGNLINIVMTLILGFIVWRIVR